MENNKEYKCIILSLRMEQIVEAIREGQIVRVPEWQAREEDLFILRKQISDGFRDPVQENARTVNEVRITKPVSPVRTWKKNIQPTRNNVISELVDNFHWQIVKVRRGRGINRRQFAEMLKISEGDLQIIENGGLPSDDFYHISKIEKVLGLTLRKDGRPPEVTLAELQKSREEKAQKEREAQKLEKLKGADMDELFDGEIELIDER